MPFIQGAVKEFGLQNAAVRTEITEARSSVAIQKLVEGEIALAFISRPLRAADLAQGNAKGKQLHMVVIAAEAVVIIVHPDNPISDISVDELRDVFFSGKIRDWASLTDGKKQGPIHVLAVNPKTSGTGEMFVSTIAGDDKPRYVPEAIMVDYSDATVAQVAADRDAISFSGMGNVGGTVKAVTLNDVAPTEKAILDTSYVLNRKLYAITDGPPKGSGREFVKFLLSETGQGVARATGSTPIVLD